MCSQALVVPCIVSDRSNESSRRLQQWSHGHSHQLHIASVSFSYIHYMNAMMTRLSAGLRLLTTLFALLAAGSDAFSPYRSASPLFVSPSSSSGLGATSSAQSSSSSAAADLKAQLLDAISNLRNLQERDGSFSIDFGVKGGEINATSRAPQKVDYYAISRDVGDAAEKVVALTNELEQISPTDEPTKYLGDKQKGDQAPLNGPWKLLFTTAADASFSKNSTRGSAKVQNIVDGARGRITNVIDFQPKEDGSAPPLKQLNVVIKAKAESEKRVGLVFKYAKAVFNKKLFGRNLALYIPVPAPFITRLIVLLSRIFKFGRKKGAERKVPKAYFDVIYLDKSLRIHRTGDDNLFVQGKEEWDEAKPLFQ